MVVVTGIVPYWYLYRHVATTNALLHKHCINTGSLFVLTSPPLPVPVTVTRNLRLHPPLYGLAYGFYLKNIATYASHGKIS